MRPATRPAVFPSTSLLHFLKQQLREPFLSTANSAAFFSCCYQAQAPLPSIRRRVLAASRHLATSRLSRANASSCIIDLSVESTVPPSVRQSNLFGGLVLPRKKNLAQPARQASTFSHPILKRFWRRARDRDQDQALQGHGLPPLPSFLDEAAGTSLGRKKAGKPGSELKLRCTEIDENGNVTTVNGEFKKSELIAKVSWNTIGLGD